MFTTTFEVRASLTLCNIPVLNPLPLVVVYITGLFKAKTKSDVDRFVAGLALWSSYRTTRFLFCLYFILALGYLIQLPASVAQLDAPSDWRPGGRGFNPRRGWQHSFVEIDHEMFSTFILSLPLIQEGQLSVSGERMCTILVNRLED